MKTFLEVHCEIVCFVIFLLRRAVFCHSIEETWTAWQDFYVQYRIVENWLSDAEQSLSRISREVEQPGEYVQVILHLLIMQCVC